MRGVNRKCLGALALLWAAGMTGAPPIAASGSPSPDVRDSRDDSSLRLHADDVVDYTLHATLDPGTHTISGRGTIRWRNASRQPIRELWLHLYLNAFKDERSDFMRERVGGRGSLLPETWGRIDLRELAIRDPSGEKVDLLKRLDLHPNGGDDETEAHVSLPREIEPGGSIELEVVFDDVLPTIVERTGYRNHFHMVGQWFPKVARLEADGIWAHFPFHHLAEFYADFGTYDVTIDVPAAYTIAATGPVVDARVEDGRRVERHVQGDVHDFAWSTWDSWLKIGDKIDGVDVNLFYPPGFDAIARRELEAIRFALPHDERRYGRYPYSVLTVVHPEGDAIEAGGMEYPTLITSEGSWLIPSQVLWPEIVTVHELGHQWFYGLVATNEEAWPFLDEGINQFAEGETMEKWRGQGSASDLLDLRLSDAAIQAVAGNTVALDEIVAKPANEFSNGEHYARLVYSRTASVLETAASVYGDAEVGATLGLYTRRYRFEHPGPEQLLAAFEETLGPRVAANLRTALFDKGWVDYTVDEPRENSVRVRRRGTLSFPVEIELLSSDGSTRIEHWDGEGESTTVAWSGTGELRSAVVDPNGRVMIDANRENNHATARDIGSGAPRTLERAIYWMQLALQAVSP